MFSENALQLELHRRGKVERFEIQQSRILIGSGAHCDLRLSPEEAAIEQLSVEARDEEVHVRVVAFEPPCTLNGAPFLAGRLSKDSLLELGGGTALRLSAVPLSQAEKAPRKNSASTPPAVQAVGLLVVAAGLVMVMPRSPSEEVRESASRTPPALSFPVETSCSQSEPGAAQALAERIVLDAESKRERSPFYAQDGVQAVSGFLRAAVCFRQAGSLPAAEECESAAHDLQQRLGDEVRARHVRVERLLAEERYPELKREAHRALELVQQRSHPYAAWLSRLEREAELRTSAKKEK